MYYFAKIAVVMSRSMCLALLCSLSFACGDDGGGPGAGVDGGSPDGATSDGAAEESEPLPCDPCTGEHDYVGSGIYEVPLDRADSELSAAAVTSVQEARISVAGGEVTLEYDLPAELTGVVQQVELSGDLPADGAPMELSGSAGTATCYVDAVTEDSFDLYCLEALPGVAVDLAALELLLEGQGLADELIADHLDVGRMFMEDPIGILDATLTWDD